MLTLTDSARDVVRELVAAGDADEEAGLRIAAEPSAEGQAALSLSLAEAPAEGDQVLQDGDTRVFLEATAASLLDDQVLDASRHEDHVHFTFTPQQPEPSNDGNGSG
jgi:Fe-S cluster assembly iron-binding protein IscA